MTKIYPQLDIPETLAAGPGPGNTDPRVLERFAKTGVADHMQKDVLRGMLEAKEMLRELWGTKNVYTYGVAGTGFSGLDCVLSLILPGDKVVAFPNGTFSGIDTLTIRMKASTAEELAADSSEPEAEKRGRGRDAARAVGDGRERRQGARRAQADVGLHGALGDGIGAHQRPQGLQRRLPEAWRDGHLRRGVEPGRRRLQHRRLSGRGRLGVVSAKGRALIAAHLCAGQLHRQSDRDGEEARLPHLCASSDPRRAALGHHRRQGSPTPAYHQTHSCYAVAAFHEALRIILGYGRRRKASDYAYHEKALRQAVEAMGCDVTSNMTSLIVLNLPGKLKGKEKELVQGARAQGFGIWPTLSEPVQVRIGILNQLSPEQIGEITSRFADAMLAMGAEFDKQKVMNQLKSYYAKAA